MITIDGNSLMIEEVIRVARQFETVGMSPAGRTLRCGLTDAINPLRETASA